MGIGVRFDPLEHTITPSGGTRYTVVYGGSLGLTSRTAERNPAPGPARLEFSEEHASGDASRTARTIATLEGDLQQNGTAWKFVPNGSLQNTVLMSDFRLRLQFDLATFSDVNGLELTPLNLILPWDSESEGTLFEVKVTLLVGSETAASAERNDSLQVPLDHHDVPDDIDPSLVSDCRGVGIVYPTANHYLGSHERLEIGSDPLQIFLHESVRSGCDLVHPGSFDLATLQRELDDIFGDAGFTRVDLHEKTTAEALAAHWTQASGGLFQARGVRGSPTLRTTAVDALEGVDIPFFEFWVFNETGGGTLQPGSHELGYAELLNPNPPSVNVAARTKRILTPTRMLGGTGVTSGFQTRPWDRGYRIVRVESTRMRYLASFLAHEIGHNLGLRHSRLFDWEHHNYQGPRQGSSRGVMGPDSVRPDGAAQINRFGPVHKEFLRRHYLSP